MDLLKFEKQHCGMSWTGMLQSTASPKWPTCALQTWTPPRGKVMSKLREAFWIFDTVSTHHVHTSMTRQPKFPSVKVAAKFRPSPASLVSYMLLRKQKRSPLVTSAAISSVHWTYWWQNCTFINIYFIYYVSLIIFFFEKLVHKTKVWFYLRKYNI